MKNTGSYIRIDNEKHTGTRIGEVRTIKGTTYIAADSGNAILIRKARYDYPEDGIAAGDVYVEHLTNGSRNTGDRYTVDAAIKYGYLYINEPRFDYYGPERGFEAVE